MMLLCGCLDVFDSAAKTIFVPAARKKPHLFTSFFSPDECQTVGAADDEDGYRGGYHEDWHRLSAFPLQGELWTTGRYEVEDVEVQSVQDKLGVRWFHLM